MPYDWTLALITPCGVKLIISMRCTKTISITVLKFYDFVRLSIVRLFIAIALSGYLLLSIDFIVSRQTENVLQDARVDSLFSDHYALLCSLQIIRPPPQKERIKYRKLKNIDFVKFNADIARSLESNTSHNLDGSASYYFESLVSILDKHAPEKTREFIIREKVPWMNEDILREKRKRKKLEWQWRSSELAVHKECLFITNPLLNPCVTRQKQLITEIRLTTVSNLNCSSWLSHCFMLRKRNLSLTIKI